MLNDLSSQKNFAVVLRHSSKTVKVQMYFTLSTFVGAGVNLDSQVRRLKCPTPSTFVSAGVN